MPALGDYVVISCLKQKGIEELKTAIKRQLFATRKVKLFLPFAKYQLIDKLKREEEIISITETETGAEIIAGIRQEYLTIYQEYLI